MTNEEAIKSLKKLKSFHNGSYGAAINLAIKALEQARPNGKWKRISPAKIYECTNCKQMVMTEDMDCYKYCHQCGANMRGDNE